MSNEGQINDNDGTTKQYYFSYEQINQFLDSEKPFYNSQISLVDAHLKKIEQALIYSVKSRVKSIESLYLKLKRKKYKYQSLYEITDIAGMRILCLFETDIRKINKLLLSIFHELHFNVTECVIYSWSEENSKIFKKDISDIYPEVKATPKDKTSGYKSIHYVVKVSPSSEHRIEFQLRTLFQDVWSELEHALNYKKSNVNPHIQESFKILSEELQAKDKLINHLKNTKRKEEIFHEHIILQFAPNFYFVCQDEITLPQDNPELISRILKYEESCKSFLHRRREGNYECAEIIKEFEEIQDILFSKYRKNDGIVYWIEAEKAFWEFAQGNIQNSRDQFKHIIKNHKERYVPYFRLGEIYFIEQKLVEALKQFDICEKFIKDMEESFNCFNMYRLLLKLANIYWLLGWEYIDLTLEKIDQGQKIFKSKKNDRKVFPHPDQIEKSLINNLCYYNLEKFCIEYRDGNVTDVAQQAYDIAHENYEILKAYIESHDDVSSNLLDTVAWFEYWDYKITDNLDMLKSADKRSERVPSISKSKNRATLIANSLDLQSLHYVTIKKEIENLR